MHSCFEQEPFSKMQTFSFLDSPLPLVVTLNCIEDCTVEKDSLSGVATVEYVPLSRLIEGKIESATAVLVHSLIFLPRAAQRRLQSHQLILCLGSTNRELDLEIASELGLHLIHVDVSRADEVADTVAALFLGLLRRTHVLSCHALSASGWMGSVQPLCRGMRRCRGLVLGIIGRSASAKCLARRSLAFDMSVLYYDVQGHSRNPSSLNLQFPSAVRRMDTLNDLLAASDLISLHCGLTNETVHILNAETLQNIKPGAFLVNTSSSQLLDDCAVKQLLLDGTLAGCALDGAEGPQWMEAWVKEMPNVLILPRSADYSEEVWMEIRLKAIAILQAFLCDGIIPTNAASDEEDEEDIVPNNNEQAPFIESTSESSVEKKVDCGFSVDTTFNHSNVNHTPDSSSSKSQVFGMSVAENSKGKCSIAGKKTNSFHMGNKSQHGHEEIARISEIGSHQEVDFTKRTVDRISDLNQPEISKMTSSCVTSSGISQNSAATRNLLSEKLLDGSVVALFARNMGGFYICKQRHGGSWHLEVMSSVSQRDPAAQFLVVSQNKDAIGLRALAAGGLLLQINQRKEFVFSSHKFDLCEHWTMEGSLEECKLVNYRNPSAFLDARVEILAILGEDGVSRWMKR